MHIIYTICWIVLLILALSLFIHTIYSNKLNDVLKRMYQSSKLMEKPDNDFGDDDERF